MYMREPRGEVPVTRLSLTAALAISVCVVLTLFLGVVPGRVLYYAALSGAQLVRDTAAPPAAEDFSSKQP
jgi:hypothetical protein